MYANLACEPGEVVAFGDHLNLLVHIPPGTYAIQMMWGTPTAYYRNRSVLLAGGILFGSSLTTLPPRVDSNFLRSSQI
jgi:hypothetical protein